MHWFWRAAGCDLRRSAPPEEVFSSKPSRATGWLARRRLFAVAVGTLGGFLLPIGLTAKVDGRAYIMCALTVSVAASMLATWAMEFCLRNRIDYLDCEIRCRKCGYILRGISEPRCPECGERI